MVGWSKRESKKNDVQNLNHGKQKGKIERMSRGRGEVLREKMM